ncbi:hypothetical protein N7510_009579 [Penicillium lagena]|uniref:uncharacterized protein n=1 Tax=Penicillium lagena TaxID=94218 RepID=UPI00254202CE|nr:uncharacterized protein N7510_009579 [Penicillium lagena]KAJ5604425.1 hypothetical protein N7510_009579 [Penicillium lagena]
MSGSRGPHPIHKGQDKRWPQLALGSPAVSPPDSLKRSRLTVVDSGPSTQSIATAFGPKVTVKMKHAPAQGGSRSCHLKP